MTSDDEMLMAYADGELGPIEAKRVEGALAKDPAATAVVARHRALAGQVSQAFTAVEREPVPDRLTAMLQSNVEPLTSRRLHKQRSWIQGIAVAATLVLGVAIGRGLPSGPVTAGSGGLRASGELASALDDQLASDRGETRMVASFKDVHGRYCRVFAGAPVDGIACRQDNRWLLLQTRSGASLSHGEYRQAGSTDAALMTAAQDMMVGDPLSLAAERAARNHRWR